MAVRAECSKNLSTWGSLLGSIRVVIIGFMILCASCKLIILVKYLVQCHIQDERIELEAQDSTVEKISSITMISRIRREGASKTRDRVDSSMWTFLVDINKGAVVNEYAGVAEDVIEAESIVELITESVSVCKFAGIEGSFFANPVIKLFLSYAAGLFLLSTAFKIEEIAK